MSQPWTTADIPDQHGRIAIVTGANSGLGLETTAALAAAGATVVMACRNPVKAQTALDDIKRRTPNASVEVMPLDMADLESVRSFATAFSAKFPRLDLLCNNAGVMALPLRRTAQGFEMQIGTNHLGHFLLTGLLIDKLEAAPAPRVMNVASVAHKLLAREMQLDDLNWEHRPYKKWPAYGQSKLANLLFTFELDRRLKQTGSKIMAVAAHPGFSATNLAMVGPEMEGATVFQSLTKVGNYLFSQSQAMGALPSLYAATAPDVLGGDYIGPDGALELRGYPCKVGSTRFARDPQAASRLWSLSAELTGLDYLKS